jgi:hypothetical protein
VIPQALEQDDKTSLLQIGFELLVAAGRHITRANPKDEAAKRRG